MKQNSTSRLYRAFFLFSGIMYLLGMSFNSQAQTTIQVTNGANIQNLIDTNPAGTIYILQPGNYSGFTVKRRVVIIGPGYFNGANTATITGTIIFSDDSNNNTTSDNSVITGCSVAFVTINSNRKNIIIQRNRLSGSGSAFYLGNGSDGCVLRQCFLDGYVSIPFNASNFQITNCIILGYIDVGGLGSGASGRIAYNTIGNTTDANFCRPLIVPTGSTPATNGIQIANNILFSNVTCNNTNYPTSNFASFNNNVIRQGNYQTSITSNVQLTDMNNILANVGTGDARFILAANSPAKLVGEGGTDAGAFGGPDPYVLSGVPIGPVIYDLQVPSTARPNESIPVRVKAKIQN